MNITQIIGSFFKKDKALDTVFEEDDNESRLQMLEEAITKLTVEEKTLISLFYTDNKPVAEIADLLEQTTDNVKVRLYRVRKKLYVLMTN